MNFIQLARETAARRADGPTEITSADEHRKTVWQRKQNLEDLGRISCVSERFTRFFSEHTTSEPMPCHALSLKNRVQWRRCFWWEDYAHLVKQAQKPNVNRKERWEGEEEEGKSAAHIPVKEDKSLSAALKMTVFGSDPVIFLSSLAHLYGGHCIFKWHSWSSHLRVILLILRALLMWCLGIN